MKSEGDSERQTKETALNAKRKATMMALNAEIEKGQRWLWTSKLGSNDGSERRNWEAVMALNAKTGKVALNTELNVWHDDFECHKPWMNGGSECQTARKW